MKKVWKKAVSMTLALAMLVGLMSGLTINAAAAGAGPEVTVDWKAANVTLTPQEVDGKIAKFALSFKGTANAQHVVFLLNGSDAVPEYPTESNIRYIDQQAAGADGKVSMTIYPDSLPSGKYAVYTSSTSGFTKLATFVVEAATVTHMLGDANMDSKVDASDVNLIYRHVLKDTTLTALTDQQLLLADTNQDGKVDSSDINALYRYVLKDPTSKWKPVDIEVPIQ